MAPVGIGVTTARLVEEWASVLARRPGLHASLAPYQPILDAWASRASDGPRPPWEAGTCRAAWRDGVPLLAAVPAEPAPLDIEPLLDAAIDALARVGEPPDALQRFAARWDAGNILASDLFPGPGRLGAADLPARTGLSDPAIGFLACAALRPWLEDYLEGSRTHLQPGLWTLGICPFCGAPPAFADLLDDGQRHLACHVCAGAWPFARLRCPHCGTDRAADLPRLMAEGPDEGYALAACRGCQGYVKELDRRLRWNGSGALVEDWGSPHLDVAARNAGYWRALVPLILLGAAGRP